MSTDEIDVLLERYLRLLDQYTTLRTELSTLQSSIHQDIARANFSSDRGIRYGQDYYDSRMCASRLIQLMPSEEEEPSIPAFTTITSPRESLGPATQTTNDDTNIAPQPITKKSVLGSSDPLNMFPILTLPSSMRSAQRSAIIVVEGLIPQLASVDAEMREVEVRVRRARKFYRRDRERERGVGELKGRGEEQLKKARGEIEVKG